MIDIILIIFLIVSWFKPEVLLSKKMKEKATEEEQKILVSNYKKYISCFILFLESYSIENNYSAGIGLILIIISFILLLKFGWPAIKENSKIVKEIKNR